MRFRLKYKQRLMFIQYTFSETRQKFSKTLSENLKAGYGGLRQFMRAETLPDYTTTNNIALRYLSIYIEDKHTDSVLV